MDTRITTGLSDACQHAAVRGTGSEKANNFGIGLPTDIEPLWEKNREINRRAISNAYKVTEDREWLYKQSAAELATFIGVTSDKIFRVLGSN